MAVASRDWKFYAYWALKIVLALLFIATGLSKLAGSDMMVQTFQMVGVGQWFRYVTGILEVGGAILLLVPRTTLYGAVLLTLVSLGALIAQVAILHEDWIHAVVLVVLCALVAWIQRGQLQGRVA